MSQNPDFKITNLLTNEELEVIDNNAALPLFNNDFYKIRLNVTKEHYTRIFRKSVRWDFGDGTIVEGSFAEHYYKLPGKYKISCTFYNIDGKPTTSDYYINVIVKEHLPINLRFNKPENINNNITRSKISKILTIESTLNNNVKTLAPIEAKRVSADNTENYYFDIKNNHYYHLERYYTFLTEKQDYSYKKNIKSKITLKPAKHFIPKYSAVYINYDIEDKLIKPAFYIYVENDNEYNTLKNICHEKDGSLYYSSYNPNISVLDNHINNIDYYMDYKVNFIYKLAELPPSSKHCGWVSSFNIWYKDDYIGEKDIYLNYNFDKFKFYNNNNNFSALNSPPLGIKIDVSEPEKAICALTANGLLSEGEYDSSTLNLDDYLKHNLYIDYEVEGYLGHYIENEVINEGEITWSLLKNEDDLLKLDGNYVEINNLDNDKSYLKHYTIKPTSYRFNLEVEDNDKKFEYKNEKIKALYGLRLPYKNYKYINFNQVLDAYMGHTMYDNKDTIRAFFRQVFLFDDLFENINNKGFDFFDDIVNHKTCYIKNLQSILEMFDSSQLSYNLNSFDKINDLKELTRILSMQYSVLFGQYEKIEQNIQINGDNKGANVGDLLKPQDIIACDKDYNIRGIIRDNKFNYVPTMSTLLILYNMFNKETRLVSLYGIQPAILPPNYEEYKELYNVVNFYKLDDYDYSWGWNLQLPTEAESSPNKANIIDTYYSLYLPAGNIETERKYNYISTESLPKSDLPYEYYMTKDEWDKKFGYAYNCLMKVLVYNLGLN